MITYFKVFVFLLFPPAAFLLALLVIPFPAVITKNIIKICDAMLFCYPHPHIPITLFWSVLILSFITFSETYIDMQQAQIEYTSAKKAGNFDRSLMRLMAEERNAWIAGFAFVLWILLHRFRNMLKRYYRQEDNLAECDNVCKQLNALINQLNAEIKVLRGPGPGPSQPLTAIGVITGSRVHVRKTVVGE